jgi:ABC-type multidrug transport system fused ATPase/permease subunit
MQHGVPRRSSGSYWESSWFSYLTYGWVNPLVQTGVERQVTLDDAPELSTREDALVNTRLLLESLDEAERSRRSHPLLRALLYTYWTEFLVLQSLRVAAHFLGLLDPVLMARVLVFQEKQNSGEALTPAETRIGFEAVSALILLGFFMIFYNSQMAFFQSRLDVRIGSALRGAVLFRCIRGRTGDQSSSGPSVYNVISFDIAPVVDIIWIVMAVWLFPIQFISTLWVLFQHVGWAIVPGLVTIIVAKLICGFLLFKDGILRNDLLLAKDTRLMLCSEGFNNVRTLHQLAWTKPFQEQIMEARARELHIQKMKLWLTKMVAALDYSLAMIVTLVTLTYYTVYMGNALKASVAIPVIQLITNLMGPIGQFPLWVNQYLVWRSAYNRVSEFIGLDNHPKSGPVESRDDDPNGNGAVELGKAHVAALKCCTLSWNPTNNIVDDVNDVEQQPLIEKTSFELQNLDLAVSGKQLVVVVGSEGQGKSSVLMGLLGEMYVKSGLAHSPALARYAAESRQCCTLPGLPQAIKEARKLGDGEEGWFASAKPKPLAVPFSAQSAMLFTGSIRMNILFGSAYRSSLYSKVLRACALEDDIASMPAGDMTEVAQAGQTLSGGQKRRISLARTVYRASLAQEVEPGITPLVLLDDPLCSLDKQVAGEVGDGLFGSPHGLLASCAVVVATADPWWVSTLSQGDALKLAVVRAGQIIALGSAGDIKKQGFAEVEGMMGTNDDAVGGNGAAVFRPLQESNQASNPQGDEVGDDDDGISGENCTPVAIDSAVTPDVKTSKMADGQTQTELTEAQKEALHVVKDEECDQGQVGWSTYKAYLVAVGPLKLVVCAIALVCIMVFQNLCNLWITYWTTEDKSTSFVFTSMNMVGITPPTRPMVLLEVFAALVLCFALSNFAGHALEIIGGVAAAGRIFQQALTGAFQHPFRWWDANPTGRVLNRFSEDVSVMDLAITNIMGVIFGALLYFVGHAFVLALSNPFTLLLLPPIAVALEYYAQFYRCTIREIHRIFRVRMGLLYQDMVEAIIGRITVRAFAHEDQSMQETVDNLDRFQQVLFCKTCLALWLGLRMALIGYTLSFWVKLQPILQYYGYIGPQATALVGLSISYSTETVAIIQQFITNYSDLEMQLISIERLTAYVGEQERRRAADENLAHWRNSKGLLLANVTVTYREGLLPALRDVSISFSPGEVTALMGELVQGSHLSSYPYYSWFLMKAAS